MKIPNVCIMWILDRSELISGPKEKTAERYFSLLLVQWKQDYSVNTADTCKVMESLDRPG